MPLITQNSNQPTKLSSSKMIGATVIHDIYTRYWILGAIQNADFRTKTQPLILHRINFSLKLCAGFFLLYLIFKNGFHPISILALLTISAIIIIVERHERLLLKQIALQFIQEFYTEESSSQFTFFALTERIAKKISTFSLVDITCHMGVANKIILYNIGLFVILFLSPLLIFPLLILTIIILYHMAKILALEVYLFQKTKGPTKDLAA